MEVNGKLIGKKIIIPTGSYDSVTKDNRHMFGLNDNKVGRITGLCVTMGSVNSDIPISHALVLTDWGNESIAILVPIGEVKEVVVSVDDFYDAVI